MTRFLICSTEVDSTMGFSEELTLLLIDKLAIGLLIAFAGYFLARLLERFKGQQALQHEIESLQNQTTLNHTQRQIEELYSPLLGLIAQSNLVYDIAKRKLKITSDRVKGKVSDADARTWRFFIEKFILPFNQQMADLIRTKIYLIPSDDLPASFVGFLSHQTQFHCLHTLWSDEGISSDEIEGIPWPNGFREEVDRTLRDLRMKYNDYLRRVETDH